MGMSKTTININGKDININTNNSKVTDLVAALLKACAERRFPVGMMLKHADDDGGVTYYQIVRILQKGYTKKQDWHRAYLINQKTGVARNSTKVVAVQGAKEDYPGYITELPAEKDRFIDPDDSSSFLDC